jgi:hypothetical protein
MVKWIAWLAFGILLHAGSAQAADRNGEFAVKGAGLLTCTIYVAERERRSNVYYMIGGWLEGFISAHNKYAPEPVTLPVGVVFALMIVLGIGVLGIGSWPGSGPSSSTALSFWHYLIYALAFVLRAVPLPVFERDAVLMKGVSLAAFAAVYLTVTPDLPVAPVVAIGLLFNLRPPGRSAPTAPITATSWRACRPKRITSLSLFGAVASDAHRQRRGLRRHPAQCRVQGGLVAAGRGARDPQPRHPGDGSPRPSPRLARPRPSPGIWLTDLAGRCRGGPRRCPCRRIRRRRLVFVAGIVLAMLAYGFVLLRILRLAQRPGRARSGGRRNA